MSWRFTLCLTLLAASVLATDAEAQRARTPRKKPFEALSQSAQRLKQTAADRLGFREAPRDSVVTVDLPEAIAHDSVVSAARSQLGTRYILGAERPGVAFDCSGLVRFVMSALRIDLPRTAHEQSQRGQLVEREVRALRPGDLLTFGRGARVTHIGVYIGEGRFVHASTSRRRVIEASIDQPGTWFRKNWVGVRRLLATTEVADTTG
ncbi:MAG: C40 family peptidase [Gemmatimonadetes bacterium]|nr:C40 family peptidase [Gemmatimonadota bacterium]